MFGEWEASVQDLCRGPLLALCISVRFCAFGDLFFQDLRPRQESGGVALEKTRLSPSSPSTAKQLSTAGVCVCVVSMFRRMKPWKEIIFIQAV